MTDLEIIKEACSLNSWQEDLELAEVLWASTYVDDYGNSAGREIISKKALYAQL